VKDAREGSPDEGSEALAQEIETREYAHFLSAIVEHIAQPVFVKDRHFRYVLVNRAFEDFVGRPRAEILRRTDYDHFPSAEADFFREVDRGVFANGQVAVVPEEPATDALGRVRKLRTIKSPIRGADGSVTHIVGVITDLSQVRAAEEELRRTQGSADTHQAERNALIESAHQTMLRKERLAVLGQLAGGLAHQIRNPLAAISTATAILLKRLGESVDPDVQQALMAIREEVREANRIITDLLDYARIKPASKERIEVRVLFDAVLEQLHVPVTVVVERHEDPSLDVLADARQLRDALGNLARNALEAMPNGGKVMLSASRDGKDVVMSVEDTGPGLRRDVISRLFEPLVTSKPLGLGLGLTLARALVENQGGVLRAGTSRGGGARFEVRLPIAVAE
jgi:PAS domain S-box-containing protein